MQTYWADWESWPRSGAGFPPDDEQMLDSAPVLLEMWLLLRESGEFPPGFSGLQALLAAS